MLSAMRAVMLLLLAACSARSADPDVDLQIVGESTRVRLDDSFPAKSAWFDGAIVTLFAARGETLGIQVLHRAQRVQLSLPGARVRAFDVESFPVSRPSTTMFGGSRGKGRYADGLTETQTPTTNPAYFEIVVGDSHAAEVIEGELVVGERRIPVKLTVANVTLPPLPRSVWAYANPKELGSTEEAPTDEEKQCIAMFREHGVLLSPDLHLPSWEARKPLLDGFPHVPVMISKDHWKAADEVRGWIAATKDTGQVPFTIPIDEPRTHEARARVRALADVVRRAGGGPKTFRYAVTDAPHFDYGNSIDLYIAWRAAHLDGDTYERWTYNGAPPFAGNVTLDARSPGTRTWGWIAWRWKIPVWYVWDALYWHDRHNKKQKLDPAVDPVSFDDGEDRGNLDGVLALPGCRPTLRLAALRRGLIDRQLLELAAHCAPEATRDLARSVVPRALGNAHSRGGISWSTDESDWEVARRRLLQLAACGSPQ
jgi:hypothetical protein